MPCLLSDRERQALHDILDNAILARGFVSGMSLGEFLSDQRTVYAVTRCLEIISEAARRLSEQTRSRHPSLPWRAIMGAGNIYRHNYDNVAEMMLWRTVTSGIEPLLIAVREELGAS
jgi:uncharacterized protein with HEPN domain